MRYLIVGKLILLLAALSACGGGNAPGQAGPTGQGGSSSQHGNEGNTGQVAGTQTVRGRIVGLQQALATVTLGDQAQLLMTTQTDIEGRFEFTGVPHGNYFIKAEAKGLTLSPAQLLTVHPPTVLASFGLLSQILPAPVDVVFTVANNDSGDSSFHWDSTSGNQESLTHINMPPVIQFRDEAVTPPDTAAAAALHANYDVVLSDEGQKWTQEYASRLLAMLATLPTRRTDVQHATKPFRLSKWLLTDKFLADDISIERSAAGDTVTVSRAAFVYATPRLVYLDGVPGRFFSKRLHHAALRFATNDGSDSDAIEAILTQRFGVATQVRDYQSLTAGTTREGASQFAAFRPQELVDIVNSFEEMPEGFYKLPGLHYLVRRAYGQSSPLGKSIIAQAHTQAGYIEFMDGAFQQAGSRSPHRVILHEKTHFLWDKVMSASIKNDWIALGGWYRNPANTSQWISSKPLGFVSAYAHGAGPDEDIAESVADYIINPNLLQSRASEKYAFIKERIFRGDLYVPVIRDDLTFMVVDLAPDYTAPGKVKAIDIALSGRPTQAKLGKITIELFGDASPAAGARDCLLRFVPPSGNLEQAVHFGVFVWKAQGIPDWDNNRTVLTGQVRFSEYAESGYWLLDRIRCTDVAGNERNVNNGDVGGAAVYVNNTLKPVGAPRYEPGSLAIATLTPVQVEGHTFKQIQVSWRHQPHALEVPSNGVHAEVRALGKWDARLVETARTYDKASRTATMTYLVPDYFPIDRYGVVRLSMSDTAGNHGELWFPSKEANEDITSIMLVNTSPDSGSPPELDLNRLAITARPAQAAAPNGETIVTVTFYARDDVAGFDSVRFRLLNPQGESTLVYLFTTDTPGALQNWRSETPLVFKGDPAAWRRYEGTITLPVGSVPGVWGVASITMLDKAHFNKTHEFVELVHFVVTDK